ncbi:Glycosyltransferase involved in cell wall bisynthesis [Sulfitobacter brevis]|uniref:Glycosyltransferase involved in cell wall bisynthesis n=1 Tax=Sulfitobacter brevis TaxID=74348 RepID=A0A1I2FE53_9RHOB|nr:glycosyltransferase family 2 protein [Sulfitobacter brevis]SFF03273.1 Glycosyltransferase involved in cell wall bisynthesis [Sulfitobacter brevis]
MTRDRDWRSEDRDGVSVVIPTCNRGTYLREAVESALAQTVDILEVIIVDDGSEVDPGPQLADLGDKVKVHTLSERGGANVARNHGIEVARGAWIALLDDDDVWQPDKTARQLQAIAAAQSTDTNEDGENGIAACICIAQDMGGPPDEPRHIDDISERLRVENPCGTSGLIARRSLLQAEPFDIAIARAQDWDLFVRLAQCDAMILLEEPLYLRRVGHDRITTRAMHQTPKELFDRACAATHKHRQWLGEPAYKRRLAIIMLSYISQRKRKLHHIIAAIRHSGLRATLGVLASKLR